VQQTAPAPKPKHRARRGLPADLVAVSTIAPQCIR
jgi:hypothetical protein